MKILAIDTSGQEAGAAIVECREGSPYIIVGEILLNARTGAAGDKWTHSEILMPAVERLFRLTRLAPGEITHTAYTCGPGSFTGLRIGAASALGIARALNIPAIAVPTLDALAYNMICTGGEATLVPMLDARRGQVYTAFFSRNASGTVERTSDYIALPVCEVLEKTRRDGQKIFMGDGADANIAAIRAKFPDAVFPSANNNRNRAASAAVWAAEKILAGCEFSTLPELMYVRQPQAVREAAARAV